MYFYIKKITIYSQYKNYITRSLMFVISKKLMTVDGLPILIHL